MKKLTETEFKALNLNIGNEYHRERINAAIKQVEEFNTFIPCEIEFSLSEQDSGLYFEYTEIKIIDPLHFIINFDSYRKKYTIYCRSIDKDFKNINHYTIQEAKKNIQEPKKIGVLTTKKINEWLNYYRQLYAALKVIDEQNSDKVKEFLKSIEGQPVRWFNNNKSGEIVKNGLLFKFKIEETYISTSIEVHYKTGSELNDFLKLADNKHPNND